MRKNLAQISLVVMCLLLSACGRLNKYPMVIDGTWTSDELLNFIHQSEEDIQRNSKMLASEFNDKLSKITWYQRILKQQYNIEYTSPYLSIKFGERIPHLGESLEHLYDVCIQDYGDNMKKCEVYQYHSEEYGQKAELEGVNITNIKQIVDEKGWIDVFFTIHNQSDYDILLININFEMMNLAGDTIGMTDEQFLWRGTLASGESLELQERFVEMKSDTTYIPKFINISFRYE